MLERLTLGRRDVDDRGVAWVPNTAGELVRFERRDGPEEREGRDELRFVGIDSPP